MQVQIVLTIDLPNRKKNRSFQNISLEAFYTQQKVTLIDYNFNIESDIEKYFSNYGKVVDVAIMRDKHTGKSRGFAFVTF